MSLITTLFVREGIVLASDSRITLNAKEATESMQTVQLAVSESDSINKTFLTPNNIGISTHGAADISGVPISGFIESFITEHLNNEAAIDEVPKLLLEYFKKLPAPPATFFHVAGYKKINDIFVQHVYTLNISSGEIIKINLKEVYGEQGAAWGGESDILSRLLQPVYIKSGDKYDPLPTFPIPFQFFTLQDAIDFAVYAISTTIDSMRFMARPKTVGGSIDVLVIKPQKAEWIKQKTLHA